MEMKNEMDFMILKIRIGMRLGLPEMYQSEEAITVHLFIKINFTFMEAMIFAKGRLIIFG
jgi:hypothetical protein